MKLFVDVYHFTIGKDKLLHPPWNVSETPVGLHLPPPALGEHSVALLSKARFFEQEIVDFKKEDVVIAG